MTEQVIGELKLESQARLGVLAGIARHSFPRAPIEPIERVAVTCEGGLAGDFRGAIKPGGRGRRQVSLMERGAWEAAVAELGRTLPWFERRCNLLIDGLELPRREGALVRVGPVLLRVTQECNPCSRMDALLPGLRAALTPDWRGGALARVIEGGDIAVGDVIRIEEP